MSRAALLFISCALQGCAATTAQSTHPADPFEGTNRKIYALNKTVDDYVLEPMSRYHGHLVPELIHDGLANFFRNLSGPGVLVNNFLQGKLDEGGTGIARFVFNSTIGIGGLVDVAGAMGLEEHREDFGQTLAVWGVPQGPYLLLPLFGPTTTRNLSDIPFSIYTNPMSYSGISTPGHATVRGVEILEQRHRSTDTIRSVDELALDPYAFIRSAFLQRRRADIFDGVPPLDDELEELLEEEEDARLLIR